MMIRSQSNSLLRSYRVEPRASAEATGRARAASCHHFVNCRLDTLFVSPGGFSRPCLLPWDGQLRGSCRLVFVGCFVVCRGCGGVSHRTLLGLLVGACRNRVPIGSGPRVSPLLRVVLPAPVRSLARQSWRQRGHTAMIPSVFLAYFLGICGWTRLFTVLDLNCARCDVPASISAMLVFGIFASRCWGLTLVYV